MAIQWIKGSPHSRIPKSALKCPTEHGEQKIAFGNESVALGTVKFNEHLIGGIRWIQVDSSNLEWTSVIVAKKTSDQTLFGIQVSCEALSSAALLPLPKKPIVIHKVIQQLGGGMDGHIPITDKPFFLDKNEEQIAAALMQGTGNNSLPIIYVSSGFDGEYIVNAASLSKAVSGLAHVVVEPNYTFSLNLKRLTASRNVYGGTIGVYWPDSNMRKVYFINDKRTDADCIQREISNDIRVILTYRRQTPTCTWLHFQEAVATNNYTNIKTGNDTEIDDLLSAADTEIKAKLERIQEQEREIAKLNAELKRANSQLQAPSSILTPGEEQELYEAESREIVVSALESSLRSYLPESRRAHLLKDILHANRRNGETEKLAAQIKAIFKSYVGMDAKTRSSLEKLGFTLSEDGKHFKAVFRDDPRYTFSISKSASDHRSGKNMASDINKILFS
ncbi:MAG: hypothetical protein AB9900_05945 [Humidesulfovibrio sp.]